MNDYIEVRSALRTLAKWMGLVVVLTAAAATAAFVLSRGQQEVYAAKATVMVGGSIQDVRTSRSDLQAADAMARTYTDLATRRIVLQPVVERLGLEDTWRTLAKRVRVERVDGTRLFEIRAEARSPEQARILADEVAQELVLLMSPSASDESGGPDPRAYVAERLAATRANLEAAQSRLEGLRASLSEAASAEQQSFLRSSIDAAEQSIARWESNYVQLSAYLEDGPASAWLGIVESAQASPGPVRPRIILNSILGGALGLLLGVAVAFGLEFLDDTVGPSTDLQRTLGVTVLGTVGPIAGNGKRNKLLFSEDPASPVAEAYRLIRSNIEYETADRDVRSIVVTSAGPGEGKSITAANLGIMLAHAGLKTIVVDADLRQPAQHELFRIDNARGLANAIREPEVDVSRLVCDIRGQLKVLTSGKAPSSPAELLRSDGMRRVLQDLESMCDAVVLDSPLALGLADAGLLASRADGVVMVLESGRTRIEDAQQVLSSLEMANASVLGVVLNKNPTPQRRARLRHANGLYAHGGVRHYFERIRQWLVL